MPPDQDPLDRLRRAIAIFAAHRAAPVEGDAALLARHPDLRELLEPMLLDEVAEASPPTPAGFRITGELGRGGMGVVHDAIQLSLGRRVALKTLPPQFALEPRSVARFHREARLAAQLDHRNIVKVLEVGEHEGLPWIAMERVDGAPIAKGPLRETVTRLAAIADALAHAHAHGVLHRDVKPANILVREDGTPVLTDFGLARELAGPSVTLAGEFAGTPAYTAPEQVLGEACDERTDVYGLGACLHELLTGHTPHAGRTQHEILRRIVDETPAAPHVLEPAVPRDLSAIVQRAMAKDPRDRYPSAAALAEDLRAFLDGRPVSARPLALATRATRWVHREPRLAAALGTIGLLLVLGLVLASLAALERDHALHEIRRLADVRVAQELVDEAAQLWPAAPALLPRLDAWLARTRALQSRRAAHAATRAAVLGDDDAARWQRSVIDDLLAALDRLTAITPSVERRARFAREVDELTLHGPSAAAAWAAAITAIQTSPHYDGLRLTPIRGLLPLGPDPTSGLHEFWHVWSGARPERDAANGPWRIAPETGIVLVLVPGGRFTMGATRPTPERPIGSPHVDRHAAQSESPVHEVALAPFLIGKYELTQGQWLRQTGSNPSLWQRTEDLGGETLDARHPVERVSAVEVDAVARAMGLAVPSEAQWERAARGGTSSVYFSGDDPASLAGYENLADQTVLRLAPTRAATAALDDGRFVHAPVGSHRPNPLGLHDMLGNVSEICADQSLRYDAPCRPGDGLRSAVGARDPQRMVRGGSYLFPSLLARCASRNQVDPTATHDALGARLARGLSD